MSQHFRVLISAAETSSDAHGAKLLQALRKQVPNIEALGIGGPHLQKAGLRIIVDARELLVMGSSEVLGRLPKLFRALNRLTQAAREYRPDLVVVMDYPDFHFLLARRLKKLGIPVLYYIPPKVWVWRQNRIHALRKYFIRVLCIFPFEVDFYRKNQMDVRYVGNPLLDELPLQLSRSEARAQLGLPISEEPVVVIMPGSRPAEIQAHLEPMLDAATLVAERLLERGLIQSSARLRVLLPFPETTSLEGVQAKIAQKSYPALDLRISQGDSSLCLVAADAGLIKSGTSTLEAALLQCPHVVVYKPSRLTAWIFKYWVRYRGPVGLVNLVGGWESGQPYRVPELLCEKVSPEAMAQELFSFLTHEEKKQDLKRALAELRQTMQTDESPSQCAAREVLETLRKLPPSLAYSRSNRWGVVIRGGSCLWSIGSILWRWIYKKGWLKKKKLDSTVISVGNIQVGGAGKTPLVALIAQEAAQRGLSVCILLRGYRSQWEKTGGVLGPGDGPGCVASCGDEAALLHDLCPQAYIGVGADREKQYQAVLKRARTKIDRVILDDGFQHQALQKDLEIVALTSAKPGDVLFRDSSSAVREADLLVWTKGDKRPEAWGRPMVRVSYALPALSSGGGGSKPLWLVTGVAQGDAVYALARQAGYFVAQHFAYPDHFAYQKRGVQELLEKASIAGTRVALTGKDWVKWREWGVSPDEVIILEPQLIFIEGQELWTQKLWVN